MWRRLRRLPAFILSRLPVPVAGGSFFQQGADILMAAAASGAWDGVLGSDLATLRRFLGARIATVADRDALVAAIARSHQRPPPGGCREDASYA